MAQQTGAIYHQGILYSGGGGTNVTPNPQGEATDTLNTVEIDGTVYGIEGGGTEVTPNPQGTATDTLNTVEIDGTVYNIESGEGSDVTITPTLNTGQKLADYSIDGTSGAIYMPTIASGDLIINPSETPTDELTKIGVSSSIEDAYLANGKIATSAGYYITCPFDKTLINGTYTVRVRDGASTYNFEVTYSGSTITKSWSSGSNNYTLTITSTTAGMSYYSGDYRNIYCDIVMMIPQIDVYSVSGGGGGSNLILDAQKYSLEEQVVGIWTDGKPLYQRTWGFSSSVTLSANTWFTTSIPNTGMEKIINVEAMSGTGTRWAVSGACDEGSYVNLICFRNRTITVKYVTVRYTKTTDVAGSGGYQAYGFSPIIYSDTEREIGVWRDNKPLYQKTINIGGLNTAGNTKTYNHGIADIDNIVYQNTIAINTTNGRTIVIPYTDTAVDYNQCISVDKTKVSVWGGVDRSMYNGYVTIQYTKTTDVAGSGEYNTLAIPNVHYSTDEQVIGTWIDGKTLYQKTCATPLTLNTGSGEKTYTLDISNVDKVISVDYSVGTNALAVNVTRTDTPDEIRARINQGNQLLVWSGYDRSTLTIYTTMKYTKTTD